MNKNQLKHAISFILWIAGMTAVPVAIYGVTENFKLAYFSLGIFLSLSVIKFFIIWNQDLKTLQINPESPTIKLNNKVFFWWEVVDGWYCENYKNDTSIAIAIKEVSEEMFLRLVNTGCEIFNEKNEKNLTELAQATDIKGGFEYCGMHIECEEGVYFIELQYHNPKFGGDMQWDYIYKENGEFIEVSAGD